MVWYNPGAIGLIDSSSFSINASLYQVEFVKLLDETEESDKLKNSELGNIPLMITGLIFNRKNPRLKFGYGIMSPIDFSFDGGTRFDSYTDIIENDDSPGLEETIAQYGMDAKLSETLVTGSLGYKLSERLAVGVTLGGTLRSHRFTRTFDTRVFLNTESPPIEPDVVTTNYSTYMKYTAGRLNLKFGLSYQTPKFSAGLTVTTPGVTVYSSAAVSADITLTNFKLDLRW